MATPITWAQEVITCDICNNAAIQFCNSCQVKLCVNCINKHVDAQKQLLHDIVSFTNRSFKVVFQQCQIHLNQRCEACCQNCDALVCMKCVITSHKGHDIEDIPSDYNENRTKIMLETEELQKHLDLDRQQCDTRVSSIEEKISKTTEEFEELGRKLEEPRKHWHQEVDEIFDNYQDSIKSMRDKALKSLTEQKSTPNSKSEKILKRIKENKDILLSKTVSNVVNYKSKLHELKDTQVPEEIDVSKPSLKVTTDRGKELSIELGGHKATLTRTLPFSQSSTGSSDNLKIKVIADIQSPMSYLSAIACVGSDEAWIAGIDNIIFCLDVKGSVKRSVGTTEEPCDIAVTKQGEVIYTAFYNKTVVIVKFGMIKTATVAPKGWGPLGLCCTNSGDILVNMATHDFSHHKIVRYKGQSVKQEIEKDSSDNPYYREGSFKLYIAENRNGDICASDGNAKKVVVVNEKGKLRFRYNGSLAKRNNSFCPEQIATDSNSQIIVTDQNNDCLHILDQNGQFLHCVDNCGLDTPGGLSVDSKGRCWIGLHSGKLKVISLNM